MDAKHKVHFHGKYPRWANANDSLTVWILRWLCVLCRHTISVLPDGMLPYRSVPARLVERHFDAQARGQAPPKVTEKERGCLQRAWKRLRQRVPALVAKVGQMVGVARPSPAVLWQELRRVWGGLPAILLALSQKFRTSLLGDYPCLQPWEGRVD